MRGESSAPRVPKRIGATRRSRKRASTSYPSDESARVAPLITVSPTDKINVINAYGLELTEYYRAAARGSRVDAPGNRSRQITSNGTVIY